jgi:hypothetical protein
MRILRVYGLYDYCATAGGGSPALVDRIPALNCLGIAWAESGSLLRI